MYKYIPIHVRLIVHAYLFQVTIISLYPGLEYVPAFYSIIDIHSTHMLLHNE